MILCKQLKAFVCFQRHPSSELQLNPLVFQLLEVKPMNRISNWEVQDEVVLIPTPTNRCHFILLNKHVTSVPVVLLASDSYVTNVTKTRLYGKIATFFSPPKNYHSLLKILELITFLFKLYIWPKKQKLLRGFNPSEKIWSSKWVHLPQIGMKIKNIWVATTQLINYLNHHLEKYFTTPAQNSRFKKEISDAIGYLNLRWPQLGWGPVPVAEGLHLNKRCLREFLEAEDGKFGRNYDNRRGYAQENQASYPFVMKPIIVPKINPRFFSAGYFKGF